MCKKLIFSLLLLGLIGQTQAQQTDFETLILPAETKARDFSEYLVQLAWMNCPACQSVQDNVKVAQDEAKNTRKEWMRDVQATFNLNEGNLRKQKAGDSLGLNPNIFFPRYNFGVNLNLYNLTTQKAKNRIETRKVGIAENEVNEQKLMVRAETLARYTQFRTAKAILAARTLYEQEANAGYILIQQLYKNDEKTFDEYTQAAAAFFQAQEARIRAEGDVAITRIRLEEVIGLKWEQVQHPAKEE